MLDLQGEPKGLSIGGLIVVSTSTSLTVKSFGLPKKRILIKYDVEYPQYNDWMSILSLILTFQEIHRICYLINYKLEVSEQILMKKNWNKTKALSVSNFSSLAVVF